MYSLSAIIALIPATIVSLPTVSFPCDAVTGSAVFPKTLFVRVRISRAFLARHVPEYLGCRRACRDCGSATKECACGGFVVGSRDLGGDADLSRV
jgi:hypothetical protein